MLQVYICSVSQVRECIIALCMGIFREDMRTCRIVPNRNSYIVFNREDPTDHLLRFQVLSSSLLLSSLRPGPKSFLTFPG